MTSPSLFSSLKFSSPMAHLLLFQVIPRLIHSVLFFLFIILFDKTVSFSFLPCSVFPQARLKPCSPSWVTNRLTAHLQSWSLRCQRSHSHKAERIDLLSHASDMNSLLEKVKFYFEPFLSTSLLKFALKSPCNFLLVPANHRITGC